MDQTRSSVLHRVLRANKWTAGLAGAAVMLAAGPLAEGSGLAHAIGADAGLAVVLVIGLALMVFSGLLSGVARPVIIDRREAVAAWVVNLAWLAVGLGFLLAPLPMTLAGIGLLALLSASAALFAAIEAYALWLAGARSGAVH